MTLESETLLATQAVCELVRLTSDRKICFAWIDDVFKRQGLRQHHLGRLAKLGLLRPGELARGGSRRYYELTDHPFWAVKP